ncbi:MAG: phosphatidate cytidylyltransferase [Deltaproteobacteria bacterium]|nr:phosphatidate cytidylyltransferase [Deltaproteobacteria bacterium]
MSNLAARVMVALVVVPGLLALLILGPDWGWWALASIACLVALYEFARMTQDTFSARMTSIILGLSYFTGSFLLMLEYVHGNGHMEHQPVYFVPVLLWLGIFAPILAMLFHLFSTPDPKEAMDQSGYMLLGAVYCGVLFACLAVIRDIGGTGVGWRWILVLLGLNWLNDTGAYFSGRFLGKRKLFPRVSPKKTWEGAIGGLFMGVAWLLLSEVIYFPGLTITDALILGLFGGIFGQVGDLVESVFKRARGVKDSGTILPGHGGILDRMDAVLFTGPVVLIYAMWLHPL